MAFETTTHRRRLFVLELTPTLEEIWAIRHDSCEGYEAWHQEDGIVSVADAGVSDAKLRPTVLATYAGGKGTNVARVLGALRAEVHRGYDVILAACHPQSTGTVCAKWLAAASHYDQLASTLPGLDTLSLRIPMADDKDKQRRAVHIVDAESGRDLLNFTPRLRWSNKDTQAVVSAAADCVCTMAPDEVVLTGTPPLGAENAYADLISKIKPMGCRINLDTSGQALAAVLQNSASQPDLVSINRREYDGQRRSDLARLCSTFAVHDASGCWFWEGRGDALAVSANKVARIEIATLVNEFGKAQGPTLGAGDAFLGGLLAGNSDLPHVVAVFFGLAAAGEAVRSGTGLSAFTGETVSSMFVCLQQAAGESCRSRDDSSTV